MASALAAAGRNLNAALSFLVFVMLDLLDMLLCLAYKLGDLLMESEWRPCYCSRSAPRDMIASVGKILVSERGGSKVVSLLPSCKLQLEDISDTLYSRTPLLAEVSGGTVAKLRRLARWLMFPPPPPKAARTVAIRSSMVQMLQGKMDVQLSPPPSPRWSDCHCDGCNPSCRDTLYVHAEGPKEGSSGSSGDDVVFIHGFISSSGFWTETVFPHLSPEARSRHRIFAVDLLGFGRSPKPGDSLYTLREHVEMIERSVLEQYKVRSFHLVAHSLGSVLALALAVRHPAAVKSLTVIAPPYFPLPEGEKMKGTQYVLRQVAPRRVWPPIMFGASVACWYEHLGRTVCLLLCKPHRLWELAVRLLTFNRVRTYLMDGFFCHTHIASWHTVHNIICGSAGKLDKYLEAVRTQMRCPVTVYHGRDDELLPVSCSYAVRSKVPRADVKVIQGKDHVTIVVGRPREFAAELEDIWMRSISASNR